MNKNKTKSKGLFKGAALGFAFVLCGAFFPVNALAFAADNWNGTGEVESNSNRIEIDGNITENNSSATVKKGDKFIIPEGEYYGKSGTPHIIGTTPSGDIQSSSVTVTYQATGDLIGEVISNQASFGNQFSFNADKLGTYLVTYSVTTTSGESYVYDLAVVCEASEASFEFSDNEKNIIPSVYDTKLAGNKDIIIPLPTVNDEDGDPILSSTNDEDKAYYILDKNGSGIPNEDNSKKCYVYISITNGSEKVQIQKNEETGEFYIEGDSLTADLDSQEFKINYSFYEVKDNGGTFITSTSKTFTVRDGYYYTDSDKKTSGYGLVTDWSSSLPDSAVVGVEVTLPTVSGKTKASNSPASEAVEVYYDLQVFKMNDNGKYEDDVTSSVITKEGKFKAVEEGSYKFVYTVKDFYGNTASSSNTTFTIDKVKDTQAPDVYMYDAGTDTRTDEEKKTKAPESAESKLKSQTFTRNIVMYAIAGIDNMPSNNLTLRREIRDASGIKRFVISEQAYNDYNLIFAPAKSDETSVYQQIVADNFEIYTQMILEGKSVTNDDEIKNWLKENNYLLVTTKFNQNIDGETISDSITEDSSSADIANAMIEAGYAYIPSENSDKQYNFSEQSYSFYYYANDNRNNNKEKSVYYSVKLTSSATDESVPTITFPTDLQSAYLPNETIEFDIATASDSIDSRLQTVTAYRYLKDGESERSDVPAGKDVVASTTTTETLKYIVENYNSKDADKWYVKSKVANNVVTSEGWYVNKEKTQYTIDLADRPQGAEYIEILCYAVDDNGNVGFFNKIISIADATDDEMPVLYKVVNAPSATDNFTAPMTINLPTLYYTDDKVDYVHADVVVYKVNKEEGSRQIMQSTGMSTKFDSIRGVYTVDAGIFNASTEGYYQVAVTISDSGNHRVTTYFNYNVKGGSIVEDPEIDNITSEAKEVAIDDSLYLTPPTVSVSDSETWGYLGLDENDDSNTSTYYTTTMVSASSNNYELDKYYFTGKAKGTYKLQYNVFLIRYNKTADFFDAEHHTTETATAGKMFINEKGQLCYKATQDNKCYYIYLEENESNGYDLKIHEDILGITGNSLETASPTEYTKLTKNKDVEAFTLTSDIQTITVKDVVITVSIDDDAYAKTQYPEVGEKLDIVKPEVVVSGADKGNTIDKEESYVQISVTTGSTTQTLATINFAEWEEAVANDNNFTVEGSNIKLNLSKNGRYTIKYSIQAQDYLGQNVGDAKTLEYTISNGDVTAPTIDFADDLFKEKYGLGEELVINLTGITVSDKVTTDVDKLLETLQIKLTNEDTDESWTLENSAEDGGYSYEHTFEEAGDYTLTISIKDEAGNTAEKSVSFTVTTDSTDPINVQEVLGGVLIGVSVAILAGVVIYFVVSKVKLDKKEKGYKSENRDSKNKK